MSCLLFARFQRTSRQFFCNAVKKTILQVIPVCLACMAPMDRTVRQDDQASRRMPVAFRNGYSSRHRACRVRKDPVAPPATLDFRERSGTLASLADLVGELLLFD